jgi:hypothetical protein
MKLINMKISKHSLWISYNLVNPEKIQQMLPSGMTLANVKLTESEINVQPKLLFNCYDIQSRWMKGSRLEIVTIAKKDKNVHFVILDCYTNTGQWDPINRIKPPNANIKINYVEDILSYNVISNEKKRLYVEAKKMGLVKITKEFAIESNYVCYFKNSDIPIKLSFDENDITKPVRKLDILNITNDFWIEHRKESPEQVFIHENDMYFEANIPFF